MENGMLLREFSSVDSVIYALVLISHCVRFLDNFEFRGHICMVFELLRSNIYEFLYQNHFYPFPLRQIQAFARQILDALSCLLLLPMLSLLLTDLRLL